MQRIKKLSFFLAGLTCMTLASHNDILATAETGSDLGTEVPLITDAEENIDETQQDIVDEQPSIEESIEAPIKENSVEESKTDESEVSLEETEEEQQQIIEESPEMSITQINKFDTIQSIKDVDYLARIQPSNDGIYTEPKGTQNSILYTSYLYNNRDVKVISEAVTQSGTFAQLADMESETILGWINSQYIDSYSSSFNNQTVNYYAKVKTNNEGIYTLPKGIYGSILYTSYLYNEQDVKVVEETETEHGQFAKLVSLENNRELGWINLNDLSVYSFVQSSQEVRMYGIVKSNNEGIYTQPKGNYQSILYTSYLLNEKPVKITEEAITQNGTFFKITPLNDKVAVGWINASDITADDFYQEKFSNEFFGVVKKSNDGIYTEPKGSFDSILYTSYLYNNKTVRVTEEATTLNGVFVKIEKIEDGSTIGWIKKSDLTATDFIKSRKTVNYYGKVLPGNDGIYTKPKGDIGSILYTSYLYNNKDVRIVEEANTLNGTFLKINNSNSEQTLGWIRKEYISIDNNIHSVTPLNDYGRVKYNNEGIYTKPKGTPGSVLYTSYLMNNKDVQVIEEAKTNQGTYVKLRDVINNSFLGWIKKSDISFYDAINKTVSVNYKAKVSSSNKGIYTSPKGTYGAILYTSYLFNNKEVRVTEEAITESGVFARLVRTDDGTLIGWINKNDLITSRVVFLDVGHGGSDSGASYYGVAEKDINLQVANKLKKQLEAQGYTVIMPRTTDVFIDHKTERSQMANNSGADIFVSIHHNAMPGNSGVNGIETFYYEYDPDYPPQINGSMHNNPTRILESAALAKEIHNSLINYTGAFDRGVRRDTFAVLRETSIPAVLLELGFMSNKAELNKLTTNSYQEVLAQAVVRGIDAYFKAR
ncbi:hypothetical protein BW721_05740 [Jeotgalibaca sp. PTS2502]|uniref:GW dipeptide domain-containing protein n=1 Tax=Jeotgalibaca sp. PTS2502 TaxID=1903686 RepID=UPI00097352E1|nr:GW dipeptide domain-containing protein [Jeotgalibaca sp. PTS2502]APZ49219.1 hypothetical protein BW721_05740 [Jeotgalibaca sp. PTS2502]